MVLSTLEIFFTFASLRCLIVPLLHFFRIILKSERRRTIRFRLGHDIALLRKFTNHDDFA